MTAPNGPILFNNLTGSDTTDSGLGPATSVNGAGASTTASSAVVTGIDTTGVSAGDLLFVDSTSGRKFSIIASVDSGTQATCDDTFDNTEASRNWGIGGKRANLSNADSARIWANDGKTLWGVEIEYTGTDYTISTSLAVVQLASNGRFYFHGSGSQRPVIEQTSNTSVMSCAGVSYNYCVTVKYLKITNSNGTKTAAYGMVKGNGKTGGFNVHDCVVGDATNTLLDGIALAGIASAGIRVTDTTVEECAGRGISGYVSASVSRIMNCVIRNNTGHGIYTLGVPPGVISGNLVYGNGADGIHLNPGGLLGTPTVVGNVIYDNTGDGIDLEDYNMAAHVVRNIAVSNGGYGIKAEFWEDGVNVADWNAFYNNTSGARNVIATGDNDITLTADPFVNAASDDFNINDTAGGGTLLRAATVTIT